MAKKLLRVPKDLTFNIFYEMEDSRGVKCTAYECDQHPEIEIRVHEAPNGSRVTQAFLVDEDEVLDHKSFKKAYRRLMERDGKNKSKSNADGSGRSRRKKVNVPKKKRRRRSVKRGTDTKQRIRRRTKRS